MPNVPLSPPVSRFEVETAGVTVVVGGEFKSTIGADASTVLIVRVSVSVRTPPVPVLPKSVVNMVMV